MAEQLQHLTEAGRGQGPRRSPAGAPAARRPDRGGVRAARRGGVLGRIHAREAGQGAPGGRGQDRQRGALHRRRGRRPLPRRPRRTPARRACRRASSSRSTTRSSPWCGATPRRMSPSPPGSSRDRYGVDPSAALRELERAGEVVRGELLPGGTRARVVRGRRPAPASPGQPRPPAQGGGGDRSARARPLPARAGRTSTCTGAPAPAPTGSARRSSRSREWRSPRRPGSATFCPGGSARTARPGSTSSARAVSSSGSAPAPSAEATGRWRSTSARTSASPARRPPTRSSTVPRARSRTRSASGSPQGPCFWLDLLELRLLGRGAPRSALGPRLVGRGDQRRLCPAARPAPAGGPALRSLRPALRSQAGGGVAGTVLGRLVADRPALRRMPPRPGRGCVRSPS